MGKQVPKPRANGEPGTGGTKGSKFTKHPASRGIEKSVDLGPPGDYAGGHGVEGPSKYAHYFGTHAGFVISL